MTQHIPKTSESFELLADRIDQAVSVLKAMSSDTRLKILCALGDGELSVNTLADLTNQSASAVSQHLTKLRSAGLVDSRRDAQTIYYTSMPGIGRELVNTLCNHFKE